MNTQCLQNFLPQRNTHVFFSGEAPKRAPEAAKSKEAATEGPEAKAQAALDRTREYIQANKKKLGIDSVQVKYDEKTGHVNVNIIDAPGKVKFSKLPSSVQHYFVQVAESYGLLMKAIAEKQAKQGVEEHSDRIETATNLFRLDQLQDSGVEVGLEEHKA